VGDGLTQTRTDAVAGRTTAAAIGRVVSRGHGGTFATLIYRGADGRRYRRHYGADGIEIDELYD
jgi:hypothetical protein